MTGKWPEFRALIQAEEGMVKNTVMKNWEADADMWAGYSRQLLVRDMHEKNQALRNKNAPPTSVFHNPSVGLEQYWSSQHPRNQPAPPPLVTPATFTSAFYNDARNAGPFSLNSRRNSNPYENNPDYFMSSKMGKKVNLRQVDPAYVGEDTPGVGEPGFPIEENPEYSGESYDGRFDARKRGPGMGGQNMSPQALRSGGGPQSGIIQPSYSPDYPNIASGAGLTDNEARPGRLTMEDMKRFGGGDPAMGGPMMMGGRAPPPGMRASGGGAMGMDGSEGIDTGMEGLGSMGMGSQGLGSMGMGGGGLEDQMGMGGGGLGGPMGMGGGGPGGPMGMGGGGPGGPMGMGGGGPGGSMGMGSGGPGGPMGMGGGGSENQMGMGQGGPGGPMGMGGGGPGGPMGMGGGGPGGPMGMGEGGPGSRMGMGGGGPGGPMGMGGGGPGGPMGMGGGGPGGQMGMGRGRPNGMGGRPPMGMRGGRPGWARNPQGGKYPGGREPGRPGGPGRPDYGDYAGPQRRPQGAPAVSFRGQGSNVGREGLTRGPDGSYTQGAASPGNRGLNLQGAGATSGKELYKLAKQKLEMYQNIKKKKEAENFTQFIPPDLRTQLLALPRHDDFNAPIKWVKFNSNETIDGLARVTDPRNQKNLQFNIEGAIYVPIVDNSFLRLGWTTEEIEIKSTTANPQRSTISPLEEKIEVIMRNINLNTTTEQDWLALETVIVDKKIEKVCDGEGCESRCHKMNCETLCIGDTCSSGCVGISCNSYCTGPGCLSMCIGEYCTAKCEGESCDARCWGKECNARCSKFSCQCTTNGLYRRNPMTWNEAYPDQQNADPRMYQNSASNGPGYGTPYGKRISRGGPVDYGEEDAY